jgi:hypothetical protein
LECLFKLLSEHECKLWTYWNSDSLEPIW